MKYRSSNWPTGYIFAHTWNAAASYVTGAHNMKFGYQGAFHRDDDNLFPTISNTSLMQLQFNTRCRSADAMSERNPIASQITLQSGVFTRKVRTEYYAFYAQEQWTKDRLTLQGALRFDRAWSSFPEQQIGPSVRFRTAIVLPAQTGHQGLQRSQPENRRGLRRVRQRQDIAQRQRRAVSASRRRTRAATSTPTRRSWCRRLPTRRGRTTTATIMADCDLLNGQPQGPTTHRIDRHVRCLRAT